LVNGKTESKMGLGNSQIQTILLGMVTGKMEEEQNGLMARSLNRK